MPLISAFYLPITPTRAIPSAMLPTEIAVSGGLNRWTHHLSNQLLGQPLRPALNRLRREILELPPISFWRMTREVFHEQRLILYGYSPSLLPKPPDWGDRIHVTWYWFLDRPSEWQPFAGEVAALNTPTTRSLTLSCRRQLSAFALALIINSCHLRYHPGEADCGNLSSIKLSFGGCRFKSDQIQ